MNQYLEATSMPRFKIEKTSSYQVENERGCYVATTYSKKDALLIKRLAESIGEKVRGLCPSDIHAKRQPKGFYVYVGRGKDAYPAVETYSKLLNILVLKNRHRLVGEEQ